jgi:N-methylhydantoinase B/oxoprolinase/acetone carboxylase alpha subunit
MSSDVQTQSTFDPATLEILRSRLIGVTEEMWNTILRTSYSTIIGAALDYGCSLHDPRGDQIAHAAGSMPLFNLALPAITRDLLARFEGNIKPGDVFAGNDPWLCCGHLPDLAVMTPVFRGDRLVAFTTNVAHHADFGGAHGQKRVREVYEEGIFLPVMKLYQEGERNEPVFEILAANIRTPEMVLGDIEAQVAANEVGAKVITRLMDEYQLEDLTTLVDDLQGRSERAMREIISNLPDGTYTAEGYADIDPEPIKLAATITIRGDELMVDYTGSADQLESGGVNCTFNYTEADTHYALKCLLAPDIPHNEGSTRPMKVYAPEGSVLNCTFPASVNNRTRVGWHFHGVLTDALAPMVPDKILANNGLLQTIRVVGTYPDGRGYNAPMFAGGGMGGSKGRDGVGGYIYPSSASNVSTEVFELSSPAMIMSKEFMPDTAGPGKWRGGPAQHIVIKKLPGYESPIRIRYNSIRTTIPAYGLFGGGDGNLNDAHWNGEPVTPETELGRDGWTSLRTDDDELRFNVSSGGGYGPPAERDRAAIEEDIRLGYLTLQGAKDQYGYEPDGTDANS